MRESCLYGSARGVLGNRHSYRNCSDKTYMDLATSHPNYSVTFGIALDEEFQ
jgi:hypothetical protein